MKKFFSEFKKFITRGNVVDMAVGVIVGSSFTAIVNSLSNNILKPIINWLLALIFGANSLSEVFTFLKRAVTESGEVDLANSIYIDWGAFINAIINFFLIALVLFSIVKLINGFRDSQSKLTEGLMKHKPTKAERAELKKLGKKPYDAEALKALRAKAQAEADAAAAEEKALAEAKEKEALEKAEYEAGANDRMEKLLSEIRDLLKK